MLGLLRLLLPRVLLPATTALGTISPDGREQGVLAGANVVMPNLSPTSVRAKYLLYDNKIAVDAEAAEGRELLERQMDRHRLPRGDRPGRFPDDRYLGMHVQKNRFSLWKAWQ